ncbi:hypothetical protein ACEQ4U_000930 [Vibrio mimicus]
MKLSKLLFLSVLVLFCVGVLLHYSTSPQQPQDDLPDEKQVRVTTPKPAPNVELSINEPPPAAVEKTEHTEAEEAVVEDERITGTQNMEQVWLQINPTPELAELKPKSQAVTEIQAIEFENIDQFRSLMEGDTATFLLPNGENIQVSIEESHIQDQGVLTWSGNFETQGATFPATFTFGQNSIMGFIGHPQGSIKIEGSGSQAWLYRVPESHGFGHDPQSHDRAH